jgi:hypothetical protein
MDEGYRPDPARPARRAVVAAQRETDKSLVLGNDAEEDSYITSTDLQTSS